MAKAKSQASLDLTGRMAKQWNEEATKAHKKARDYNEVRRDRMEKLRRAVTEVWAALEAGKTVNDCTGKEEWARWYSENARTKNPIRQIQKIIAGPKPPNPVRVNTIKIGDTLKIGNGKFTVTCVPEHDEDMTKTKEGDYRVHYLVMPVEEPAPAEGEPSSPRPAKKTRSQKQSHKAVENKQVKAQAKTATKKLDAAHTQYAIDDLHAPYKKDDDGSVKWAENFFKALEKESEKHPEWRLKTVQRNLDQVAKWIHARTVTAQERKQPKTHAMRPAPDDNMAWCGKLSGTFELAKNGAEPTCKACQQQEWMASHRKATG
jgi:hypothetical protein